MSKLFLLDAYALIYRAYYAFIRAPRINSKGQNTSAIFGFVNTLEDVLKKEQPTSITVNYSAPNRDSEKDRDFLFDVNIKVLAYNCIKIIQYTIHDELKWRVTTFQQTLVSEL